MRPRTVSDVRIAVVDDEDLFAEALEVALRGEGHDAHRVPVPHAHAGTDPLLRAILKIGAQVVLLDLDLGVAGNGTRLIAPLVASGAAVVVVTGTSDRARWGECLGLGARAIVDKHASLNSVLVTIRRIADGRAAISRADRDALLRAYTYESHAMQDASLRLEGLTLRERQVLGHLMAGLAVRDIARAGVVSESTVRTQVKAILAKLEVSSQIAAVGVAHRATWHPPPHPGRT